MSLDPALRTRIESILAANPVVLFMKGTRAQPRCGFSAAAVNALDGILESYHDVDVLADPALREGIKAFGEWPTIPQLYVGGELVGGTDIILGMLNTGELYTLFGQEPPARVVPTLMISDAAAAAIREALADADDEKLHLAIDPQFRAQFMLKAAAGHEIVATANGIEVLMDLATARRAEGLEIDWVETVQGGGLAIKNPNAPNAVRKIAPAELAKRMAAGTITVVDVRPAADRLKAPFPAARPLDPDSASEFARMPKNTALAFLCHHGNSSRAAAEHFRGLGFSDVYNVEGGIDRWSVEVDPSVPRY